MTSGKGGKNPSSARRARGLVRWEAWVAAELDTAARQAAEARGVSLSEWLRAIVEARLRKK